MPTTADLDKTKPNSRPYRLTMTGGRCLATFKYRDHALQRAQELINERVHRRLWVRDRTTDDFTVVGRRVRLATSTSA